MIIGLKTKPGLAAHLTGSNGKPSAATSPAAPSTQASPSDSVNVTFPSASDPVSLQKAKLQGLKSQVSAQEKFLAQYEYVPDQVIVRVKSAVANLTDFLGDYGAELHTTFDTSGLKVSEKSSETLLLVDLKGQLSVAEAMVLMARDERVSVVESNDIVRAMVIDRPNQESNQPNDLDESLWGLNNTGQNGGVAGVDIGAKQAWETSVGSRTGPIVAVIDSGVDTKHPDLKDNIFVNKGEIPNDGIDNDGNGVIDDVSGYNAAADSNDPKDENGHGTHVAGTIGAVGNNGKGITGVNQQAQILPIRFLDKEGNGNTADSIKSILYASKMGARVVNNSWGGNKYNQLVFDVMADSKSLFVCAAGNEAFDNDLRPVYPANYDLENIISVTAHDRKAEFPKFANRGEKSVDLAAPGVDINSTRPNNMFGLLSGTSMATPHVAGALTLIATAAPESTNEDLRFRLLNNLDQLPKEFGSRIISGGRLNVGKALEKDTTAPAPVGELKLESATSQHLQVSWKAPGDDGSEGKASGYDVRYTLGHFAKDPEAGGIPFEEAKRLPAPTPKESGKKETINFSVPPSGRPRELTLGVVGVDNVLNKGPLETLTISVPVAKVALEDWADTPEESAFLPSEHWTRVAEPGRGMVYTESPEGDYPSDRDAVLQAKTVSLKGFKKPVLHFDVKWDVELKHDRFTVEYEKDGFFGKSWKELKSFDGLSDWQSQAIDLQDYTGYEEFKLRFRLKSDRDRNRDGVYLDNIVVAEADQK